MKTPTLIVRLVGIYLTVQCAVALIQLDRLSGAAFGPTAGPEDIVEGIRVLSILGLIAGLAATSFAGILARWLTFDSEPGNRTDDLSDRLLSSDKSKADRSAR